MSIRATILVHGSSGGANDEAHVLFASMRIRWLISRASVKSQDAIDGKAIMPVPGKA